MKYIIGVDGGGTKTEAVAYSLEDEEIGKGYSGFGNLLLDFNGAVKNITDAIEKCMNSLLEYGGSADCLCIYLGIAGIEVGGIVSEEFRNCLKRDLDSIKIMAKEDISATKGACYLHRRIMGQG